MRVEIIRLQGACVVLGSALRKLCSTKYVVKIFRVNASVPQASVCKSFVRFMFLCKRFRSNSKSFLSCRRAEMS